MEDKDIDFQLCPLERPNIDKSPLTYYLTISVILSLNDCLGQIIKTQEKILKDIDTQSLIGSGIYKYPVDSIHFSIIDFKGLSSSLVNKNEFEHQRQIHIDKIINIFKGFQKKMTEEEREVSFKYIYTKKSSSLAIQAFPSKNLLKLFCKMKNEFNKDICLRPAELSGLGPQKNRYKVNIVRFFRELSDEEYSVLNKEACLFNESCEKKDENSIIDGKIKKISFVLSDNWFSNQDKQFFSISLI